MTGSESRKLAIGDRVYWNSDLSDQGEITEISWAGVTVKWQNRNEQAILHNDMTQLEKVPTHLV